MLFFGGGAIGGTKLLRVKGVGYNVERCPKIRRGYFKD
jgi:hypothetical protein